VYFLQNVACHIRLVLVARKPTIQHIYYSQPNQWYPETMHESVSGMALNKQKQILLHQVLLNKAHVTRKTEANQRHYQICYICLCL